MENENVNNGDNVAREKSQTRDGVNDIESQESNCVNEDEPQTREEGNAEPPSHDGGDVESRRVESGSQGQPQARGVANGKSSNSGGGGENHSGDREADEVQVTGVGQEEARDVESIDDDALEHRDLGVNHLWRDILPTIDHADFAYTIVDVRNAIREGKVSDSRVLHTPFSLYTMLKVIEENGKMMKDVTDQYETSVAKKQALKRLKNECLELGSVVTNRAKDILDGACNPIDEVPDSESLRSGVIFVAVDDEKEKEEAVYHICVSHNRKSVYVVFRGSATVKDWAIDLKVTMTDVVNPVKDEDGLTKRVKIHSGFFEYLMKPRSEASKSKFNSICDTIKGILAEHPDYQLLATGHSLGAALSTLFTFYAASLSDNLGISTAIKCINIGSPTVGNMDFRMAFQRLERQGKIRQLRIINEGDPIPRMPKRDPLMGGLVNYFDQSYRYRHVGLCVELYGEPCWRNPKEWRTFLWRLFNPFYWFLLVWAMIRFQKRPSFVLNKRKHHSMIARFFLDLISDIELLCLTGFLCCEGPWDGVKFHSTGRYRDGMIDLGAIFSKFTFDDVYSRAEKSQTGILEIG